MSIDGGPRLDPKYARVLLPAVMATAMSLVMSLVDTIVGVGFAANLVSAWLGSFAVGVVVAAPTAILIAPAPSDSSASSPTGSAPNVERRPASDPSVQHPGATKLTLKRGEGRQPCRCR